MDPIKSNPRYRSLLRACLLALPASLVFPLAQTVRADDGTWTNTAGGSWGDTGNWSGGAIATDSGFNADFSTLDITTATTVNLDSARMIGTLVFDDTPLTGTGTAGRWILDNNGNSANVLTLGGAATITVNAMTSGRADTASNVTISAVIAGTNGLTKNGDGTNSSGSTSNVNGTGTLTLSGANTYTGATNINTGTIRATNASAFGGVAGDKINTNVVNVADGARLVLTNVNIANTVNLNGANALAVAGATATGTLSGIVNLESDSTAYVTNVGGNNRLNFSSAGELNLGSSILTIRTAGSANTATIAGTLTGDASSGINYSGGGSLTISDDQTATYFGNTTMSAAGTLIIGSDGALGAGTFTFGANDAAVSLRSSDETSRTLGNALVLSGNENTTSIFNFGSTNADFNGDLIFSNTGNIDMGIYGRKFSVYNRTQFNGAFTGTAGITKQTGTGTLVLAGANTYTGDTVINAGTMAMGANNVFAVTNFVLGGGTFDVGTFSNSTVGTLSLTGNSTITLGDGGTFAFSDSSALDWASFTLSISGTFVDGVSLRFGTDASGLTEAQLALISINGVVGDAFLNESGYLMASAIPEPSSYALLAGAGLLGFAACRRRRVRA